MSSDKNVFISYAAADTTFAARLAALMADRGFAVVRGADLAQADRWSETLRQEIEKAAALVLLLPASDAPNRNSLWFEAGAARALGKPVLGVLPPGTHLNELPRALADILVLDTDHRPLDNIADMLAQAVPELDLHAS